MEDIFLYPFLSFIFLIFAYKFYHSKTSLKNLPPSPPSLPILGHLHLIKPPVHRAFLNLSQKYGPIFSLKFGSRRVVVVSSPSTVEDCFTENDIVLANRPQLLLSKHLDHHSSLASSPYGDHWRNLRRIGTIEIFSTQRLNTFLSVREDEVRRLLNKLSSNSQQDFTKVELQSLLSDLTLNNIMRMVAGKRYYGDGVVNVEEVKQFKGVIAEIFRYGGASHPEDFLPILNWVNGFERKMKVIAKRSHKFFQMLIDGHRNKQDGLENTNTMIDHMLKLQKSQPEYYTDETIRNLIMVLLTAGTDTSAATIEWAMSNLVNHPEILKKAQKELDSQVGQERLVNESDLSKLPYLQNIISETLRLFLPGPLLVPHFSSNDCTIGGYNVPKNTIVLVNAWAVHRDPAVWDDPTSFKPERFDDNVKIDAHKLLPFGIGRRACPGAGLAQRMVGLTLGSLIQCFEWKRIDENLVDMTEGEGLTMPKAKPLVVMCKARDIVKNNVISEVVA